MKKIYRLYIDESGTHEYSKFTVVNSKEQYLCLLGVIIEKQHNEIFMRPKWEEIRAIFTDDADLPPSIHCIDMISNKGSFSKLSDPIVRAEFDSKYLSFLKCGEYTICSVVIDKKSHSEKYGISAMHPYHYCFHVLLERYVRFLSDNDAFGDVLAEVRGKKEDRLLSNAFEHFYNVGTNVMSHEQVQKRLTSKSLKLKDKTTRICGLELADMLALPIKFLTLHEFGRHETLSQNFTKQVIEEAKPKIRSNDHGEIKGYGIKLI